MKFYMGYRLSGLALLALMLVLLCWLLGFLTLKIYRSFKPIEAEEHDGFLTHVPREGDGVIKAVLVGLVWLALIGAVLIFGFGWY
ncbi:hypothetical protein ACFODZ_01325 [Marinicella sediminis]|uniref:Uncharacterized protein n=1 Tax=Marinicella sediminis TaxID=1792834 RepID=A0ABV7J477_9GAMM|nr:hypothetical protein [Marinicella sediminis]